MTPKTRPKRPREKSSAKPSNKPSPKAGAKPSPKMRAKPSRGRSRLRRLALVAIGAAVLTSLAATSIRPGWFKLVRHLPGGDKTGHFFIMGTVTFLVTLAFASARVRGRRLGVLGCTLAVGVVVTVDELLQMLFPSRTFSLADLLANWLGILIFGTAAWLVLRIHASRQKRTA